MRFALALVLLAACAGPAVHATTMVDQPDATSRVATVDLAPINASVPIGPTSTIEQPELQSATKRDLANAAINELGKRSYTVGALLAQGTKSSADATLVINSGAYVPQPHLGDDTFFERPASQIVSLSRCNETITITDSAETVEATNSNDKVVTPDEPPAMYVGMTLVDNKTGAVIWRAHGTAAANASHDAEVASTLHSVIASLPARR